MPAEPTEDIPASLPDAYWEWRAGRLGRITDALEEKLILYAVGPPSALRILDAGCGDAVLAVALAQRGAAVTGVDANSRMLAASAGIGERRYRRSPSGRHAHPAVRRQLRRRARHYCPLLRGRHAARGGRDGAR